MGDDLNGIMEKLRELLQKQDDTGKPAETSEILQNLVRLLANTAHSSGHPPSSGTAGPSKKGAPSAATGDFANSPDPEAQSEQKSAQSEKSGKARTDTIMKLKAMYEEIAAEEDPRVTLLSALKPYLSPQRLPTLENAIQVIHLTKLSPILNETGNETAHHHHEHHETA